MSRSSADRQPKGLRVPSHFKRTLRQRRRAQDAAAVWDGFTVGPDGTLVYSGAGGQKLTEGQSKDIGFYTRGTEALNNLGNGEALTSYKSNAASHVPLAGNALTGVDYQRQDQAGREFLASILRRDSGAAITDKELDSYSKTYLPRPGDSAETLKQKAAARQTALDAIKLGMGPAQQLVPQGGHRSATPDAL